MVNETFVEWMDDQFDYGLCPPPMSSQKFEEFIIKYLASDAPAVILSTSDGQCRTELLFHILSKYSKDFQREWRKHLEEN